MQSATAGAAFPDTRMNVRCVALCSGPVPEIGGSVRARELEPHRDDSGPLTLALVPCSAILGQESMVRHERGVST
jgi:hypothetical protein